jgi:hypothetical protein
MNKHRGMRLSVLAAVVGALLTAVYILPNYHALAIKRECLEVQQLGMKSTKFALQFGWLWIVQKPPTINAAIPPS